MNNCASPGDIPCEAFSFARRFRQFISGVRQLLFALPERAAGATNPPRPSPRDVRAARQIRGFAGIANPKRGKAGQQGQDDGERRR